MKIIKYILLFACFTLNLFCNGYESLCIEDRKQIIDILHNAIHNLNENQLIVFPLTDGHSNSKIYRINVNHEDYVLRINDKNCLEMNKREIFYHLEASKMGIAPKVYFVSEDASIILMAYIPGDPFKCEVAKQISKIEKFAKILQNVHRIPPSSSIQKPIIDRMEEIYIYLKEKNFSFPVLDKAMKKIYDFKIRHKSFSFEKVTIHGDLHQGNILLYNHKIFLIDWDKAGFEDPYYDLSSFALCHDFNHEEEELLLTYYLGEIPSQENKERYSLNKHMNYLYFALELFYEAHCWAENVKLSLKRDESPKDWFYYIKDFENHENLSPQFLYNFGKCSLINFLNYE